MLGGLAVGFAGVEISETREDLAFERAEAFDLTARVVELLLVDLTHLDHRRGRGPAAALRLDVLHDRLDVGEAEAEVLQLAYPANADERLARVKAVATLRARR